MTDDLRLRHQILLLAMQSPAFAATLRDLLRQVGTITAAYNRMAEEMLLDLEAHANGRKR